MIDRIKFDRETVSSHATTNRYLALMRAILKRACDEWEWLEKVPKFKLFKEAEGRVRSLTLPEFQTLLQELPQHLADMALFAVATGLRQANVKGLQWQCVDLQRQHAWVPGSQHKNGKPHPVPLNEMAMSVLLRQVGKHTTHVFTFRGQPVTQVNTKAWTGALKRAGIADFRWHDLRHTFATRHRQAGTPTHELQRLGGSAAWRLGGLAAWRLGGLAAWRLHAWKTGVMVERYAHVAPEALQSAASRLDAFGGSYVLAAPMKKDLVLSNQVL